MDKSHSFEQSAQAPYWSRLLSATVVLFQQIVQYYLLQRAPHEETVMDKKTDRPISLSVFFRNLSEHLIYFLRVLRPALSIAAQ